MLWAEEEQVRVICPPIFRAFAFTPLTETWPEDGLCPIGSPKKTGPFIGHHTGKGPCLGIEKPQGALSAKMKTPQWTHWDGALRGIPQIEALRWKIFKLGSPG